jgi:predicted metal-dependent phosphoesterase TrpH
MERLSMIQRLFAVGSCLLLTSGWAPHADGQDRPPAPKIDIVSPTAGAEVTGALEISAQVTLPEGTRAPKLVFAGLGGDPWVKLTPSDKPGQWTGTLDSTMVPNGTGRLTIVTDNRRTRAEVEVTIRNPVRYFFADLHSHTSFSDGTLLPTVAHQYARDVAGLDVFILSDHLEHVSEAEWLETREVAWKANQDGQFVVLPGLEWTKKQGHMNIFDPKTRHWPNETEPFYEAISKADVVVKFNHPGDGSKVFDGLAYSAEGDSAIQMMEVRQPTEEKAFLRALAAGWHIAPEGSDDTHAPNWGNCRSWTVILAPGLSKRNIWDALKKRHLYSTLDRNCLLRFTLNGAVMGDILEEPVKTIEIVTAVDESEDDDLIVKIELFEDGKVIDSIEPNSTSKNWKVSPKPAPGPHYYFVKVTEADGNMIWSAPIWVTVAGS